MSDGDLAWLELPGGDDCHATGRFYATAFGWLVEDDGETAWFREPSGRLGGAFRGDLPAAASGPLLYLGGRGRRDHARPDPCRRRTGRPRTRPHRPRRRLPRPVPRPGGLHRGPVRARRIRHLVHCRGTTCRPRSTLHRGGVEHQAAPGTPRSPASRLGASEATRASGGRSPRARSLPTDRHPPGRCPDSRTWSRRPARRSWGARTHLVLSSALEFGARRRHGRRAKPRRGSIFPVTGAGASLPGGRDHRSMARWRRR